MRGIGTVRVCVRRDGKDGCSDFEMPLDSAMCNKSKWWKYDNYSSEVSFICWSIIELSDT